MLNGIHDYKKEFVLSHTFKNVSKMKIDKSLISPVKKHANFDWYLSINHNGDDLGMYIHCKQSKNDGVIWFIEAEIEMTLDGRFIKSTTKRGEFKFSTNAPFSHGFRKFISWNKCVYRIGDSFNAKVSVKIRKAIGNCKSVLRSFDKSNEIGLEVLIETYWAEYYVMREVLTTQSAYFMDLLKDPGISKVKLDGDDLTEFQNLLEVLHGMPAIDENTVVGILHLATDYKMPLPIQKCEEFLTNKSTKSTNRKLKIASEYRLDSLKAFCLTKLSSPDELRAALAVRREFTLGYIYHTIDDLESPRPPKTGRCFNFEWSL